MKIQGTQVLIAEEDPDLLDILADYFESVGATVFRAMNGAEAWALAEAHRIDFVLSDIQMPVMGGKLLLKNIRLRHPYIPVVLLATGESAWSEASAIADGAAGLILKPFGLKALADKIAAIPEPPVTSDRPIPSDPVS